MKGLDIFSVTWYSRLGKLYLIGGMSSDEENSVTID